MGHLEIVASQINLQIQIESIFSFTLMLHWLNIVYHILKFIILNIYYTVEERSLSV